MNTNARNKKMHDSPGGGDDKINKQTKLNIDVIRWRCLPQDLFIL